MTRIQFLDETDRQLFMAELGRPLNEVDTADDHKIFIKRRENILPDLIKNKRLQSAARHQW